MVARNLELVVLTKNLVPVKKGGNNLDDSQSVAAFFRTENLSSKRKRDKEKLMKKGYSSLEADRVAELLEKETKISLTDTEEEEFWKIVLKNS